jgi:hypothetical protein
VFFFIASLEVGLFTKNKNLIVEIAKDVTLVALKSSFEEFLDHILSQNIIFSSFNNSLVYFPRLFLAIKQSVFLFSSFIKSIFDPK